MSRTLEIKFYLFDTFHCSLNSIVDLITTAGWCITDDEGKINIWNSRTDDWESHIGQIDNIANAYNKYWFYMYNSNHQIIKVHYANDNCFSIYPEAHVKKVAHKNGDYFDLNWYYEHFVKCFNRDKPVVERVMFDDIP